MSSRALLATLCRQLAAPASARAARDPLLLARRFKASSATAVKPRTVSDSDVTEVSDGPMTSSKPDNVSRVSLSGSESKTTRSAHSSSTESVSLDAKDQETIHAATENQTSSSQTDARSSRSGSNSASRSYVDFESARPFSEMPAPLSLPIIGTMWMSLPGGPLHGMTFEEKIKRLYEMFGPIIRDNVIMGYRMVHVYKPEDMEAVYRVEGPRPRRDAFRMLKKYNTDFSNDVQGLLTSQGDAWHTLRSKAQVKMMKPKSASAYLHLHNAVSNDFVSAIDRLRGEDGIIEDVLPELYKFAMEGIGCVCFNRRLGAQAENIPADSDTFRFIEAVSDVMQATHNELSMIFMHSRSSTFQKLVRAQSFIRQLSIKEAMRTLEDFADNARDVDGESGDLIPYLMTKTSLSEDQVMTIVSEFFFAGVDTTSHLLGFALYCLAKNPEIQDKLVQEIEQLMPEDGVVTANILGRMSYLKAVTKETFRMFPITPGNGRTLEKDVVLSGYHVPAGTAIGLHHDWAGKSELYVKEPDAFRPERWLRGSTSTYGDIHPFILMPFGFGPRSCLGRRFAEQEYSLGLIKILQKYHLEYAYDKDLKYEMCIVNKPLTPLRFRFVPRK